MLANQRLKFLGLGLALTLASPSWAGRCDVLTTQLYESHAGLLTKLRKEVTKSLEANEGSLSLTLPEIIRRKQAEMAKLAQQEDPYTVSELVQPRKKDALIELVKKNPQGSLESVFSELQKTLSRDELGATLSRHPELVKLYLLELRSRDRALFDDSMEDIANRRWDSNAGKTIASGLMVVLVGVIACNNDTFAYETLPGFCDGIGMHPLRGEAPGRVPGPRAVR